MARQRFNRKALKEDVVQDTLFSLIDWAHHHRKWIITGVSTVLLIGVGIYGYLYYHESSILQQSNRFSEIEQDSTKKGLTPEQQEDRARARYQAFIAEYPQGALTPLAWLRLAGMAWEKKDLPQVQKAFQSVLDISTASSPQKDRAHLGLALLAERKGDLEAAEGHLKALSDQPYADLKAYHLGRIAQARKKPDEARQHFEKVSKSDPGSTLGEWARQNLDYHP